ncbi:hypothetical protein [Acrocarpospora catenulata]|uniref:hypothetical protein n=1 Tax=Acrocarpospora catenulata TaxID=2836182 RepID=UPI001BDAA637|nr:hypothetical protein [Acrocarpospora catenulata]
MLCPLVGLAPPSVMLRAIRAEVHGPARSGPVPSGPAVHTHSVVGPAVHREVTGPATSRNVSGTGV